MRYWHALLYEWRNEGRDGFTIPFIIGSQQFLSEKIDYDDINGLIKDIVENGKTEIYISYCMNINDLIIGIRDSRKKRIAGFFPKDNSKNQEQFFLTSFVTDLGSNIEEIINNLQEKYKVQLERNNYSINNREPGDFNSREKKFIERTFKKHSL